MPAPVEAALRAHPQASLASSLSSSPRIATHPSKGNRDSLQRKQLWWLPYVVLEFDKNEVLVDALGGDLNSPVWMYSATFDVSRISEISLNAYLRTTQPSSAAQLENGNGKEGADMGNSDLLLGGIRFTPDLETGVSLHLACRGRRLKWQRLTDEWVPLQSGSGAIHIQVSFKPAQVSLLCFEIRLADE